MAGSLRAIINEAGNVDRFIDVSGNVIYIEPKNYTEAVNSANSAAANANSAAADARAAAAEARGDSPKPKPQPDPSQPDPPQPDQPKPDPSKPDPPQPDQPKPDPSKPDPPQPDQPKPDPSKPTWDETTKRYTATSMAAYAHKHRDGKIYGVKIPKSAVVDCIKIGAAEGIAAPTPGVIGTPCVDPFAATGNGPHWHEDVCGGADPDGAPFVDGIEGDGRFSLTDNGSGNNVYVMCNVIWQKFQDDIDNDYIWWYYSDTRQDGYEPNPQAWLPDGTLRDYMLTPKYGASKDADGNLRSVSGAPLYIRKLSHDSGIDEAKTATTGYSLKSVYDDWYIKFSYITRYGTKNFQKMFTGCTMYNVQTLPALAETGVKRVVVGAAAGAKFLDGSYVSLGTHDTGISGYSIGDNRSNAKNYDVFDMKRIVSHETLADGTVALNIECDKPFDTGTSYLLSTMPWWTGVTDAVEGDGSPSSNTSYEEPCKVGGVELMYGAYELVQSVMQQAGNGNCYFIVNPDSRNETKEAMAPGAINTGISMVNNYTWANTIANAHGLLVGQGGSGDVNRGLCDVAWNLGNSISGLREHMSFGGLGDSSYAGPWSTDGTHWLNDASWNICSRLSATGRGGEEAQATQSA